MSKRWYEVTYQITGGWDCGRARTTSVIAEDEWDAMVLSN